MEFKLWFKKNNSLLSKLYDNFINICLKNNIILYDDNKTKIDFAYMIYVNSIDKIELSKDLYDIKLI